MTTIDSDGKTVQIAADDLVRVDGIGVFRRVRREGVVYLQFMDKDRFRASCRGSKYVEVPLAVLIQILNESPPEVNG